MSKRNGFAAVGVLAVSFAVPTVIHAQTPARLRTLITEAVDPVKLVTLARNTRPEANSANDRGVVPASQPFEHLWLVLKRAPEQQAAFDRYVEEQSDPESPNYHKWLTAVEIGERYGLTQEDLDTVTNWLRDQGFTVNTVLPNRTLIDFSGTAGDISRTFHTEIHNLDVKGQHHIANMSDPQIPAALAAAVAGIVSLNDFRPHKMLSVAPQPKSMFTDSSGATLVGPADFAKIYDLNPVFKAGYTGLNQTIVVVEDSDLYATGDWTQFRRQFGLSSYRYGTYRQVNPSLPGSPCVDPGANSDEDEAAVDVEWASAAAPNAHIVLAACANTINFGGFIALQNLINGPTAPPAIVSISYGEGEDQLSVSDFAYISALYQQAAAEGVSVFVAAGDSGADTDIGDRRAGIATVGITPSGFASTPYNVSVGGTDYEDTFLGETSRYWNVTNSVVLGSAKSYIPEIPWNNSCASRLIAETFGYAQTFGANGFCNSSTAANDGLLNVVAGSGGPSTFFAKPSWQKVFGNPSDGVRDQPDVSFFAASGIWNHAYMFCFSAQGYPCSQTYFYEAGGTSFSSPIMAGIQALINQKNGLRWGNPAPAYYSMARGEYGSRGSSACDSSKGSAIRSNCIFHDVTQGDMDIICLPGTPNCYAPSGFVGVLSVSPTSYEPAYTATPGWDFATGLGTVNAYNLVTKFPTTKK